jgi:hypothetical protein
MSFKTKIVTGENGIRQRSTMMTFLMIVKASFGPIYPLVVKMKNINNSDTELFNPNLTILIYHCRIAGVIGRARAL